MATYGRPCEYCGAFITLTDATSHGRYVALDPQTGSAHRCSARCGDRRGGLIGTWRTIMDVLRDRDRVGGCADTDIGFWAGAADGEPFTYPTRCWICRNDVFAHSNGFGDFVVLDPPLRPPWQVHDCYALGRMKGRKLVEVIREGLLALCDSASGEVGVPSPCGVVLARLPSSSTQYKDELDILIGGRRRIVEIDYWRFGPRTLSAVWLLHETGGGVVVIPVDWEKPPDVESALAAIAAGERHVRLATLSDEPQAKGTVVGIERAPGYVLKSFTSPPEIEFYGEKPRLMWLLSGNDRLVPVIVKRWLTNQRLGTSWWASGRWDRVGELTVLVVQRLL